MVRLSLSLRVVLGVAAAGFVFAGGASGQVAPSQSVVSDPSTPEPSTPPSSTFTRSTPSIELVQPTTDASETMVDPLSLVPDLPKLPAAKASLIGGNIGRLDRVRDQITVQVFGGGKMKISFDPRSRGYHDGAEASLADLRQGDRVYVETILHGSTVFSP